MADVTQILQSIERGDRTATSELLPLVYDELKALASSKLRRESAAPTLTATVLVHEAYLRLVGAENEFVWETRGHFFSAASEAMRRFLVDRARKKRAQRRGGGRQQEELDEISLAVPPPSEDILALDEALDNLAKKSERKAELVKLRFFAGLTGEQAAKVLGMSTATAERDWAYARAWLHREIVGPEGEK